MAELQVTKNCVVVHADIFFSTCPQIINKIVIDSALLHTTKIMTIIMTILAIRFSSITDSGLNDVNVLISSLVCLICQKNIFPYTVPAPLLTAH